MKSRIKEKSIGCYIDHGYSLFTAMTKNTMTRMKKLDFRPGAVNQGKAYRMEQIDKTTHTQSER